jgi:hypothetical protein
MALEEYQLADIRQGIAERHVNIGFGPPPHWFELDARPNQDGHWIIVIRIRDRTMKRGPIPEKDIEATLREALEPAIAMSKTSGKKASS